MPDAHQIARSCGIVLKGKGSPHTSLLKPKTSFSRGTIVSIAKAHGDEHVCRVLECIISAEHNQTELYGDTIKAVSEWMVAGGFDERDTLLLNDYMAAIYLSQLRLQVKEIPLPDRPLRMADRLSAGMQNDLEWRPVG